MQQFITLALMFGGFAFAQSTSDLCHYMPSKANPVNTDCVAVPPARFGEVHALIQSLLGPLTDAQKRLNAAKALTQAKQAALAEAKATVAIAQAAVDAALSDQAKAQAAVDELMKAQPSADPLVVPRDREIQPEWGFTKSDNGQRVEFSIDPSQIPQKFFGAGAPGAIPGATLGDLYLDQEGKKLYVCGAATGCGDASGWAGIG